MMMMMMVVEVRFSCSVLLWNHRAPVVTSCFHVGGFSGERNPKIASLKAILSTHLEMNKIAIKCTFPTLLNDWSSFN